MHAKGCGDALLGWGVQELPTAMRQSHLPSEGAAESKELLRRITGTLTLLPKISTSAWVSWLGLMSLARGTECQGQG